MHRNGGDRGAGAGAGAPDPRRRVAVQEQRRQGEDQHEPGDDEAEPADERSRSATQAPRAEDRELRRGRSGKEVARGDGILELGGLEPAVALDAELAEQRDVRRRAAEADASDAAPLPRHRRQTHRHAAEDAFSAMQKLLLRHRIQAVVFAYDTGIVQPGP